METIHECLREDKQYEPIRYVLLYYAPSQEKAIKFLEQNGGGIYRNILHNFKMTVESNKED